MAQAPVRTPALEDTGTFVRTMLRLAIPIAAQNLLASCMHLIDTAMVIGLGNVATAAIGVAARWTFLTNLIYFGLASGSAALIAQYWGARQPDHIRKTYGLSLTCAMGAAALYLLAALLFAPQMMRVFTDDAQLIQAGAPYLSCAAMGAFAVAYIQISCSTLRATENVWLPFGVSAAGVLLNTALNYGLIYGKFGLPALGLRGAALATVIAQYLQVAGLFAVSAIKKQVITGKLRAFFGWSRQTVAHYLKIAMPVVANEGLWALGTNVYGMVLARQGTENYAAYTIFNSIEQLAFVFLIGMCHASSIMVGKAIGAGDRDGGWRTAKRFMVLLPVFAAVLGLCLIALRWPIIGLLNIETQAAREMTALLLVIYGLWMGPRNISYIAIVGIFRAGGDTRTGFYYDLINVFCIAIPLVCFLGLVVRVPFQWVVLGMYLGEDTIKSIVCIRHFRSGKWIRKLTAA